MRRIWRRVTAIVACAAVAAACGGTTAPAGSPAPPALVAKKGGLDGACATYAATLCQEIAGTSPAPYGPLQLTPATCAERLALNCVTLARAPGSGITPEMVQRTTATPRKRADLIAAVESVVSPLPHGTSGVGAACGSSHQCASGFCDLQGQPCGACAPHPWSGLHTRAEGQVCRGSDDCAAELLCWGIGPAPRCTRPAPVGGACDASRPCGGDAACTDGKCAVEIAPKDVALPRIQMNALGEACGMTPATGIELCGDGYCAGEPFEKGVCTAFVADGKACKSASECVFPAKCAGGRCTVPTFACGAPPAAPKVGAPILVGGTTEWLVRGVEELASAPPRADADASVGRIPPGERRFLRVRVSLINRGTSMRISVPTPRLVDEQGADREPLFQSRLAPLLRQKDLAPAPLKPGGTWEWDFDFVVPRTKTRWILRLPEFESFGHTRELQLAL